MSVATESHTEKLFRLRAMCAKAGTWDLSPNDVMAIQFAVSGFPNPRLVDALEAVLMFHGGGPWTSEMQLRWGNLTDHADATSKGLCDFIRKRLDEPFADYVEHGVAKTARELSHEHRNE